MPRNIELKARLRDPAAARLVARRSATASPSVERQIDTYFCVRQGRLKLREINGRVARLVWYVRHDGEAAKPSNYQLVDVVDPAGLKTALAAALGIRAVVDKTREIWLIENVRIHLDEVVGLGAFLEFEAVLADGQSDDEGHRQVARLTELFGIAPDDRMATSYGEMLSGR